MDKGVGSLENWTIFRDVIGVSTKKKKTITKTLADLVGIFNI